MCLFSSLFKSSLWSDVIPTTPLGAIVDKNLVSFPIDGHTFATARVSNGWDSERENFSGEVGISLKMVRPRIKHQTIFEVALIAKATDHENARLGNLGGSTALARRERPKHIHLRGGDDWFPEGLHTVKVLLDV